MTHPRPAPRLWPGGLPTRGYAAASARSPLAPFEFERRAPGPKDVHLDILFCGVCHSDLHQARDEWGGSMFPMVPGHEIIGRVKQVGRRGHPLHRRRPGRRRLHGGLLPPLRRVPRRAGAVLSEHPHADVQQPRPHPGRFDIRRLLEPDRGGRGFRAAGVGEAGSGSRGPASLRRDHDVLAAPPLAGRPRSAGRRRRPGRARPHGRQARPGDGRGCVALHDLSRQGGGCPAARRRRGDRLPERGGDEAPRPPVRFHPRHRGRAARPRCLSHACSSATARSAWSARRTSPIRPRRYST